MRVGRGDRGGRSRETLSHFLCSYWVALHLSRTLDKIDNITAITNIVEQNYYVRGSDYKMRHYL